MHNNPLSIRLQDRWSTEGCVRYNKLTALVLRYGERCPRGFCREAVPPFLSGYDRGLAAERCVGFCRKFFATTDHAFAQAESQVASE